MTFHAILTLCSCPNLGVLGATVLNPILGVRNQYENVGIVHLINTGNLSTTKNKYLPYNYCSQMINIKMLVS